MKVSISVVLIIVLVTSLLLLAGGAVTAVTLLSLDEDVEVTEISFSVSYIDMIIGDVCDLPIVMSNPKGNVKIMSSNIEIVKVEAGKITALNTFGSPSSRAEIKAINEEGAECYLSITVYDSLDSFLNAQGSGLYVAYRVYNNTDNTWRLAGFNRYEPNTYVNQPIIPAKQGYDINPNWYSDENFNENSKITFQGILITKSFTIYTEEYLRDGSQKVAGHIDLNIGYDSATGVYVVTGLKYGDLNYKEITIPQTYTYEENGVSTTVEIKGIADNAFYYGMKTEDGTYINKGLQTLEKIDLKHISYIGKNAFKNCLTLKTVVLSVTSPPTIASSAFDGTQYIA